MHNMLVTLKLLIASILCKLFSVIAVFVTGIADDDNVNDDDDDVDGECTERGLDVGNCDK